MGVLQRTCRRGRGQSQTGVRTPQGFIKGPSFGVAGTRKREYYTEHAGTGITDNNNCCDRESVCAVAREAFQQDGDDIK